VTDHTARLSGAKGFHTRNVARFDLYPVQQ
jgi:hypothetical protein